VFVCSGSRPAGGHRAGS